jgi:hypothetical protein
MIDPADRGALAGGGRYGALVCGAYGMRNAGAEAILRAVAPSWRSIDPERPSPAHPPAGGDPAELRRPRDPQL